MAVLSLSVVTSGAPSPPVVEFGIACVDVESGEQRFAVADACSVLFEDCLPVWGFPAYKG
ncbi:hypothetical protein ACQP0C_00975 [Nocardia sp. CA-129566]|uniref:hypothetical protein n=1 Tax=Nocardia sp. CA-129566 TaxID=3239976 RepID=UPI003D95A049